MFFFFFGSSVQPLQYALHRSSCCNCFWQGLHPYSSFRYRCLPTAGGKWSTYGEARALTRLERCQQDEEQRENHPIHRQLTEMQVQLSWDAAGYIPTGHQLKQSLIESIIFLHDFRTFKHYVVTVRYMCFGRLRNLWMFHELRHEFAL